ncbi:MAG: ferredoxin [Desulfovibrionaceae bacterium]
MSDVALILDTEDCISCRVCYDEAPAFIDWNDDDNMPVQKSAHVPKEVADELISVCPSECYSL